MCGINILAGGDASEEAVDAMNRDMVHRGPDQGGVYFDPNQPMALGARRLKIIDLEGGEMPYQSADGRYAMVFNGELYNFEALRERCSDYPFQSRCDGEVLFALLQREGWNVLKHCHGMFSFGFWDAEAGRLLVGRDRFGIKPLFWGELEGGGMALSSELRTLKKVQGLTSELNLEALKHYLSLLCVPEPQTLHKGCHRFPAGHVMEWTAEKVSWHQYYQLTFKKAQGSGGEWKTKIRRALFRAVDERLVSDVPLGLFLSSGLDSSLLASVLVNELGVKPRCHGMAFEGGEDETALARKTADSLGLEFVEHTLGAEDFLHSLKDIVRHFDEPFAGGVPLWFLCREASKDLTVALTGTGSDEIFGNYGRYRHLEPNLGPRRGLVSFFKRGGWKMRGGMEGLKYLLAQGAPPGTFYQEKVCAISSADQLVLRQAEKLRSTADMLDDRYWSGAAELGARDRLFALDLGLQLKDEFLFSQDLLSMAHSMELRVPFLDHRLVETMASVPEKFRSKDAHEPKAQMISFFGDLIPKHLLGQPKQGFFVPYGNWLRRELRSEADRLFSREALESQGLFDPAILQKWWSEHLSGQDHEYRLWPIFIFQMWHLDSSLQKI